MKVIFRNLLVLSFFLFVNVLLIAQTSRPNAKLEWGKEYNEPSGTQASKIVALTGSGIYVLREKAIRSTNARPKIYLEKFNRKMDLVKSEEMNLKYKNKRRDFEEIIYLGGEFYLMTSFNNEAKQKNYLFKQKLSKRSMTPARDLDMVAETEAKNKENEGTFHFHISKDSSKILIYNTLPYKKKEPEQFAIRVFDNQFEKLWSKNIKLPYPDHQFAVEEYRVDNNGNVFVLGVLYKDGVRQRRKGTPNYQYVILAYTSEGEEKEEYHIDLKEKFITDLTFRVNNDGNLICSGFYSEKGTYSIKGTYFFRLDAETKKITTKSLKEFDFDFLTEHMGNWQKDKAQRARNQGDSRKEPELYEYALDKLILRSDGGAVLVAEQYFVEERQDYDYNYGVGFNSPYTGGRQVRTTYYYNYNDILVINIRPNGEIEWASRIPKKQETTNDGGYFSSYAMAVVRDKIYFVYNDNSRNFEENKRRNRIFNFNGSNSIITLSEISKDGSVSSFPLYRNKDARVIARPKICKQIGQKEMAIYGERVGKFKFASLKFE